jgi:hypothetical protein
MNWCVDWKPVIDRGQVTLNVGPHEYQHMGLFDIFRRKPPEPAPDDGSVPLEQTSYDIAYFILPRYVFASLDRIIDLCTTTPSAAGPFYYIMACQARGFEPDIEAAKKFKWHTGDFGNQKYLALEYPAPTPVDMGDSDPITIMQYFSVILYDNHSQPRYFILGQSPIGGGTTVRTITAEGMNCNMGPGPEPNLSLFFEAIRERQSKAET